MTRPVFLVCSYGPCVVPSFRDLKKEAHLGHYVASEGSDQPLDFLRSRCQLGSKASFFYG